MWSSDDDAASSRSRHSVLSLRASKQRLHAAAQVGSTTGVVYGLKWHSVRVMLAVPAQLV